MSVMTSSAIEKQTGPDLLGGVADELAYYISAQATTLAWSRVQELQPQGAPELEQYRAARIAWRNAALDLCRAFEHERNTNPAWPCRII